MRRFKWIPVLMAAVLAACAQQPARESSARHAHQAIDYGKYVQGDVPWFNFTSLYRPGPGLSTATGGAVSRPPDRGRHDRTDLARWLGEFQP